MSPIELPNPKADNFVDFAVTANGKPVVAKLELRAFQDKKDVTEELQRYGLTASLLTVKDTFAKLPPTQKADLVKKGLVFGEDGPDPNAGAWNMQATYYWTQLFPAHSTVDVVHTYKPVVGGSYVVESGDSKQNREWWEGIVGDYCGGPGSVRKIEAVEHTLKPVTGDTFMFEHQVQYILRTANNWNGPIGKFHLTIRTNNPEDVLATCFPDLRKTSPTTYEATRKNFSPSSDLDLNILQHDR